MRYRLCTSGMSLILAQDNLVHQPSSYHRVNSNIDHGLGSLPNVLNWSTIELGCAVICACLPTYGPFIKATVDFDSCKSIWTWCSSELHSLQSSRNSAIGELIAIRRGKRRGSFDVPGESNSVYVSKSSNASGVPYSLKGPAYPLEPILSNIDRERD